ncbi:uncharacterized protein LOC135336304 [Halichondria panicea]|uniref:uncharacterized protein LOC135336304 n=1 Tax=Halichondria panicea TaxID=6063 RepID=UPI00312B8323
MEHVEKVLAVLKRGWESEERKWFILFRSPVEIWADNPTYLACELVFYVWTFLILRHACKYRGRCLLLLMAALFHGLVTESLSYILPDIDNFWHGRTMVMLLKQRLPLHIMLFYPCFHYTTNMAAANLKLPWWAEPFAVALGDLLLDIPFDILGIKLIWWTWHDTDPNIFDRTYSVPWTSYIFHLTFAASFTFLLNSSRWLFTGSSDKEKMTNNYFSEFACVIITACLSMPMAALLQFTPLYHAFHDMHGVHTEVCVCVIVGLYVMLAWSGDRGTGMEARNGTQGAGHRKRHSVFNELSLAVVIHYLFYIVLVFVASPESYRSTGPHETVGDCDSVSTINTVTGLKLTKKTFLCASNYSEPYFDFHCLSKNTVLPSNGSSYYTICGTPFPNIIEYKFMILGSCLFGLAFYYQWFFRSARPSKMKKA